jgi:hypothetical protein
MARGEPSVICDLQARPVTPEQAKRLISEHFTVTAEVRRRRRSTKKAGKALMWRSRRNPGHRAKLDTRRPSPRQPDHPSRIVNQATWHPSLPRESNRGGDRQANHALWRIALVRMRCHPPTRAYVERRTKQGLSKLDIMRCLKRDIAREVYHHLTDPPTITPTTCPK